MCEVIGMRALGIQKKEIPRQGGAGQSAGGGSNF